MICDRDKERPPVRLREAVVHCRKNEFTSAQCKYLNNIIEQDHRRIKRLTRPMLGFKNFHTAQRTLAGIEVMAMIRKGQLNESSGEAKSPAEQF